MKLLGFLLWFYVFIWVASLWTGNHGQPTWGILVGGFIGEALYQGGKYWLRKTYPATFAARSTK